MVRSHRPAPDRLRKLFDVNVFAPIDLIRSLLPLLRNGTKPAIVNIGSVLAFAAVPNKSEYCASKFALRGFSDSLRAELAHEGIDVISVHPNTTKSEFFDRLVEKTGEAATNPSPMSSRDVALRILHALERGKPEVVLTFRGKLMIFTKRFTPSLYRGLVRRFG